MLAYVLVCGAVFMVLEKDAEIQEAQKFLSARKEFCEDFFVLQQYDFATSLQAEMAALSSGSVGEIKCFLGNTNQLCARTATDQTERHCHQFCCEKSFSFCTDDWCVSAVLFSFLTLFLWQ